MQERSPSGAQAKLERSLNGAEDSERSTGLRNDALKQKRSPNEDMEISKSTSGLWVELVSEDGLRTLPLA